MQQHSPNHRIVLILWVGVLNSGIALGVWQVGITPDLPVALLVSFVIGYSILFTNLVAQVCPWQNISPIVVCIVASILGLLAGLVMAGYLISGDFLFFIAPDNPTLLLSLLVTFMASSLAMLYLYLKATRDKLQQAQIKQLEHDKQLSESQLQLLQAQIEPHFLFNTLANIISLIDTQPQLARTTLEQLTQYLRASFCQLRQSLYQLDQEIELIRVYLEIQKLRMGERLTCSIDNQCAGIDCQIPPLLIQPLVENAIIHGIEPLTTPATISIVIQRLADRLHITITDNGAGLSNSTQSSKGYASALENIRKRLKNHYDDKATISLTEQPTGGTSASLILPFIKEPQRPA